MEREQRIFFIAVTKFAAAALTGSSAMLPEGIHSVVDTGNQSLLLLGESASTETAQGIRGLAESEPDLNVVKHPYTMHFGPDEILFNLSVRFSEGLTGQELAGAIDRLEKKVQKKNPSVKHIFIEAESIAKSNPAGDGKRDEKT